MTAWRSPLFSFCPGLCGAARCAVMAVLLTLGVADVRPLAAQDAAADEAVESGRRALGGFWGANWYDSAQDDVRPLTVAPPPARSTSNASWNWLGSLGEMFRVLGIVLLIGLLALLVYMLVRVFWLRDKRRYSAEAERQIDQQAEIDRVEALPMNVRRPRGDLLSEAERRYREGAYGEAMIYLYSHFLVRLDRQQFIRLTRGKTNRQYLQELRGHEDIRRLMETTVLLFEDVFFGKHTITREQFELAWRQLNDFHAWTEHPPHPQPT